MAEDYLASCSVEQVAASYRRLADAWSKNMPELQPALAGTFLRAWVDNRNPNGAIQFDAPPHLRSSNALFEVQAFHRDVFLTTKRARFSSGAQEWAGVLPRMQGAPGFTKWDMSSPLPLEYESLCDIAPNVWAIAKIQRSGTNAEPDIFGSLRGFQLKSKVIVLARRGTGNQATVQFQSWTCSATDRYDWDYSEHLTVVDPDYQSKAADSIRPEDRTLTVFHRNARRLEDTGLAAPYDVVLRPCTVTDQRVTGPAAVDIARRL